MAKKDNCIRTERLLIVPMTPEELRAQIDAETREDVRVIYEEKLKSCVEEPDYLIWYTPWKITLIESGLAIGDVGFKGPHTKGTVEIGYHILPSQQKQGYMTEALGAVVNWALSQKDVYTVTAETAPNNRPSQLVLEKNGFVMYANGKVGPRYKIEKKSNHLILFALPIGLAAGAIVGYLLGPIWVGALIGIGVGAVLGVASEISFLNKRKRVTEI